MVRGTVVVVVAVVSEVVVFCDVGAAVGCEVGAGVGWLVGADVTLVVGADVSLVVGTGVGVGTDATSSLQMQSRPSNPRSRAAFPKCATPALPRL